MKQKSLAVLLTFFMLLGMMPAQTQDEGSAKGEPDFVNDYIDVEATAVGAKRFEAGSSVAYVNAVEAARVLAQARCAEILAGTQVEGIALLKDMGNEFTNRVSSELKRTHVPGGKVLSKTDATEFQKTNMVTVTMRFPLHTAMQPVLKALGPALREAEAKMPAATLPAAPVEAAMTPASDGLIVVVPEGFKPTIAPKIFNTKDELVYGANSVAPDVLVTQGVAQFTNNSGKAKATLESHGVKGPMVLNGFLKGDTDVRLSEEDAAKVLGANARTNFLQKGQVVIVIGKA